MLGADDIRRLIPHQGTMCLLERVVAWDRDTITCLSTSHKVAGNPLRRAGAIAGVCGIEYCLQAAAVHGALVAGECQPRGYLVRLADIAITVATLDELGETLIVRAELAHSLPQGHSYGFTLTGDGGATAISGRATIALVR